MRPRSTACAAIASLWLAASAWAGGEMIQLDPFAQATRGFPACPERRPRLLTAEQARHEAHVRAERGFRCADEGTCEPGGAYRRDPEINARVQAAIAADPRFADTAVWVTTSRRWVTLEGCVRTEAQRRALVALLADQRAVEKIFDQLVVGAR